MGPIYSGCGGHIILVEGGPINLGGVGAIDPDGWGAPNPDGGGPIDPYGAGTINPSGGGPISDGWEWLKFCKAGGPIPRVLWCLPASPLVDLLLCPCLLFDPRPTGLSGFLVALSISIFTNSIASNWKKYINNLIEEIKHFKNWIYYYKKKRQKNAKCDVTCRVHTHLQLLIIRSHNKQFAWLAIIATKRSETRKLIHVCTCARWPIIVHYGSTTDS